MTKQIHGITILKEYIFNTYIFSTTAIDENLVPPFMAAYEIIRAQFLGQLPVIIAKINQEYQHQLIRTERHAFLIENQHWNTPNIEKSTFLIPNHKWGEIPTDNVFLVNDQFLKEIEPRDAIIPDNIEKLLDKELLQSVYQQQGLLYGAIVQKSS